MRLVNIKPDRGVRLLIGALPIVALLVVYAMLSSVRADANPDDKVLPTFAAMGVPLNRPVAGLKFAHEGRLLIENVSACPSGSEAVGRNSYRLPEVAVVAGVPVIVGAWVLATGTDGLAGLPPVVGVEAPVPAEMPAPKGSPSPQAARASIEASTRPDRHDFCIPLSIPTQNPGCRADDLVVGRQPRYLWADARRPEALRPRLATGLLLNEWNL